MPANLNHLLPLAFSDLPRRWFRWRAALLRVRPRDRRCWRPGGRRTGRPGRWCVAADV